MLELTATRATKVAFKQFIWLPSLETLTLANWYPLFLTIFSFIAFALTMNSYFECFLTDCRTFSVDRLGESSVSADEWIPAPSLRSSHCRRQRSSFLSIFLLVFSVFFCILVLPYYYDLIPLGTTCGAFRFWRLANKSARPVRESSSESGPTAQHSSGRQRRSRIRFQGSHSLAFRLR